MGDGSGHGGHGGGHGDHKAEPTTEIGRMVRDVLAATPQLVTTLHAKPDDHGHDGDEENFLDARLTKLIEEIKVGLKGPMRNPAGLVADCKDALDGLLAQFKELKPSALAGEASGKGPHQHLTAAVLLALAVVAGAFLLFGAHSDVVYQGGSEPDYRQFAYPGAVDAPNLGAWLAWAVLLLAVAGGAIWAAGMASRPVRNPREENARLRKLYENGVISGDLYERGRKLAPDLPPMLFLSGSQALPAAQPSEKHAKDFSRYILALADTYNNRRRLERVA